jgi:multidrug resistance protein MdtO
LFTVVFVIPRIDGIVGLLLTVLPVIGLGAWIAAGSERISYAGIQVMFTFSLAILEHFGPSNDLTEIRDRMVGILLGVILAVAVQTLIWPEGEGEALRQRLADLLRAIAARLRSEEDATGEGAHLTQTREQMRVWTGFAATQAMLARVTLEPDWNEAANEGVIARAQAVLSSAREIIRAAEALDAQLAMQAPVPPLRAAVQALRIDAADALERYAAGLEAEPPSAARPSTPSPAASGLGVHGIGPDGGAGEGVQPVITAAQDLMRQLGGLPDWTEPMPARAAAGAPLPR